MSTGSSETWPVEWVKAVDGSWTKPMCNWTQFADVHNCSRPEVLPMWPLFLHVYGLISPAVILFTIVTNTLVSAVLLRPSMRSATNVTSSVMTRLITQRHGSRLKSRLQHKSWLKSSDVMTRLMAQCDGRWLGNEHAFGDQRDSSGDGAVRPVDRAVASAMLRLLLHTGARRRVCAARLVLHLPLSDGLPADHLSHSLHLAHRRPCRAQVSPTFLYYQ